LFFTFCSNKLVSPSTKVTHHLNTFSFYTGWLLFMSSSSSGIEPCPPVWASSLGIDSTAAQVNCCFSFSILLFFFFPHHPSTILFFLGLLSHFTQVDCYLCHPVRALASSSSGHWALASGSSGIEPWPIFNSNHKFVWLLLFWFCLSSHCDCCSSFSHFFYCLRVMHCCLFCPTHPRFIVVFDFLLPFLL